MSKIEHDRTERLTVNVQPATLQRLRTRQAQIEQALGVRVSLSQAAESVLRRGLDDEQARN